MPPTDGPQTDLESLARRAAATDERLKHLRELNRARLNELKNLLGNLLLAAAAQESPLHDWLLQEARLAEARSDSHKRLAPLLVHLSSLAARVCADAAREEDAARVALDAAHDATRPDDPAVAARLGAFLETVRASIETATREAAAIEAAHKAAARADDRDRLQVAHLIEMTSPLATWPPVARVPRSKRG